MRMAVHVVRGDEQAEPNHISTLMTAWKLLPRDAGDLMIVMMAAMTDFVDSRLRNLFAWTMNLNRVVGAHTIVPFDTSSKIGVGLRGGRTTQQLWAALNDTRRRGMQLRRHVILANRTMKPARCGHLCPPALIHF